MSFRIRFCKSIALGYVVFLTALSWGCSTNRILSADFNLFNLNTTDAGFAGNLPGLPDGDSIEGPPHFWNGSLRIKRWQIPFLGLRPHTGVVSPASLRSAAHSAPLLNCPVAGWAFSLTTLERDVSVVLSSQTLGMGLPPLVCVSVSPTIRPSARE